MEETTTSDVLEWVSKRNPGALSVCFKLMDYLGEMAVFDFAQLKQMNVLGSDLWDLFAHCCHHSISKTHAAIMENTATEQLKQIIGSSFYQGPQKESE